MLTHGALSWVEEAIEGLRFIEKKDSSLEKFKCWEIREHAENEKCSRKIHDFVYNFCKLNTSG